VTTFLQLLIPGAGLLCLLAFILTPFLEKPTKGPCRPCITSTRAQGRVKTSRALKGPKNAS